MKVTYRVPTREYAYIEIEQDNLDHEITNEDVVERYFALEAEYRKKAKEYKKKVEEQNQPPPFKNDEFKK